MKYTQGFFVCVQIGQIDKGKEKGNSISCNDTSMELRHRNIINWIFRRIKAAWVYWLCCINIKCGLTLSDFFKVRLEAEQEPNPGQY